MALSAPPVAAVNAAAVARQAAAVQVDRCHSRHRHRGE